MLITTDVELLHFIHSYYGGSVGSQADMASELKIGRRAVSCLTQEAGYHRHKLVKPASPSEFANKPYVKYFMKNIKKNGCYENQVEPESNMAEKKEELNAD